MTARLGASATDVIREILDSQPEIRRVFVVRFPFTPALQDRFDLTVAERDQIDRALAIRGSLGLQFWDSVLLTSLSNPHFSTRFLAQAKAHNRHSDGEGLPASGSHLEQYVADYSDSNVAFLSKVVVDTGEVRHLPLLDFHCANNAANLALAEAVIDQLELSDGFLLESGDSYHFYGTRLLTTDEYVRFMGLALHYSPIVDRVWIAHQLREMTSALRITPKHGRTPTLVKRAGG